MLVPPFRPHRLLVLGCWMLVMACGQASTTSGPPTTGGPGVTATATAAAGPTTTPRGSSEAESGPPGSGSPSLGAVPPLKVDLVVDGLTSPVDVADPGDGSGRRFVVEQPGRIRIVGRDGLVQRPFLDIAAEVRSGGEQGLLGLAFHPDYPTDPRFFVDYTDRNGDTVIAEFRADATDPDLADGGSERPLLHIDQPYANHNGGALAFGPDGMLYIGMGDGGSAGDPHGNGQRTDTLLGKILRIDVDGPPAGSDRLYRVPPDNPYVGVAGAKPEIWLTGLRNPWRIRFDGPTGDLWIGDVGQGAWEEVDVARSGTGGLDFGWNRMEGFHCFLPSEGCDRSGLTLPVAEYGHDLGCAVIGGVVVRDSGQAGLDGRYLFSDSCSSRLWLIDPSGKGRREPAIAGQARGSISSINQDADGTVLATDLQGGRLLTITVAAP
jgi:glucose/arabinose dehydrogenase